MKTYLSRDELINPYETFSKEIFNIFYYHSHISRITNQIFDRLNTHKTTFKVSEIIGMHNALIQNPINGKYLLMGYKDDTIENKLQALFFHYNKQHQWLLVEAYELFEKYLRQIYARLGFLESDFWSQKHLKFFHENLNDLEEFMVATKKLTPNDILKQIRQKIEVITFYERSNPLKINYYFFYALNYYFRNIIVHNGGFIDDIERLKRRICKKAGLYNNGKIKKEFLQEIQLYIGTYNKKNMIILYELPINEAKTPMKIYIDRFEELVKKIASHAFLVNTLIMDYCKNMITLQKVEFEGRS